MSEPLWHWIELQKLGGASGGLAGKVFKGIDTLTASDLLAREVIQNSWDASRKLNSGRAKAKRVPFKMEFRFMELTGQDKVTFLKTAGLEEIHKESKSMKKSDSEVAEESFKVINSSAPLRLLVCSDFGAHGLYGSINMGSDSILFRALYMFGDTGKADEDGTGGSYGFGKSAFIRGSGIQTVFAYSSFATLPNDKVTRRLVGTTYWGSHRDSNGRDLEGRAIYGDPGAGEPGIPFEDGKADDLAKKLFMELRSAEKEENLGTSLLLVHPQVEAEELIDSIEKWWWPALVDNEMEIVVHKADGKRLMPRPMNNSYVRPFLKAYELAVGRSKQSGVIQESLISNAWQEVEGINIGSAALRVASEEELANEESEGGHFPRIALLRSPKMIIEYKDFERRRVAVRGVFVASNDADGHLRNTEPAQHSHWDKKKSKEIPAVSTAIADAVYSKLSTGLRKFIEEVSPTPPNERETLSVFSELMRGLLAGKKAGPKLPPKASKMPLEINFIKQPSVKAHRDQVFTESIFKISLGPNAENKTYNLRITADFQILEEESDSGESWPCHVTIAKNSANFEVISTNELIGRINVGEVIEVQVKSDLYDRNWTSKLKPQVEVIPDDSKAGSK
jgi:hypothetical protein